MLAAADVVELWGSSHVGLHVAMHHVLMFIIKPFCDIKASVAQA